MPTFKPVHMTKGNAGTLEASILNATFDCFATMGLYQGRQVEVTTDKDSVVFSNGEFSLDVMETILCFKKCEVPNPCNGQEVISSGERFLIDKVVHDDGSCICVTVSNCGSC